MFLRAQSGIGRELECDDEVWEGFPPSQSDGHVYLYPISVLPCFSSAFYDKEISPYLVLDTDSTLSVRGAAPSKTAKVNDHQTTGKAKVAVSQSAISRSATFRFVLLC